MITDRAEDPLSLLQVDESISMAFLVLLERLTPVERAVFLLREVFDCEYAEIAQALGKDEANCRQIFRRARGHIAEARTRFDAPAEERERLLAQFLRATSTGDMNQMIAMLSADAVLHSDGGGKAPAVPNLVHGAANVARAILGALTKLLPRDLTNRIVQLNGVPGVVSYRAGRPFSVLTLGIGEGRIRSIYIVSNPEKLAHLPPLPPAPC